MRRYETCARLATEALPFHKGALRRGFPTKGHAGSRATSQVAMAKRRPTRPASPSRSASKVASHP